MGGGCELAHIEARTIVANDLHRHLINLARVVAHPTYGAALYRRLRRSLFHPEALKAAQFNLMRLQSPTYYLAENDERDSITPTARLEWAEAYFIVCWMGRSGVAGTDAELRGGLALRWDAGGGDSAVRYRSATRAILDWRRVFARCTFSCMDAFDFLEKCKDRVGHGVYADAPWPDDGDNYLHKFTDKDQRRLATRLASFTAARVVVRYGDHPMIRELYPRDVWTWHELDGRTSANKAKGEVLLVRNGSDNAGLMY